MAAGPLWWGDFTDQQGVCKRPFAQVAGLKGVPGALGIYAAAINQGTFCHEPGDVLQRTGAQNGALARVRSAFVIN
jgi:hypothetical protein